MQFKVPQNIDMADRIVGPLTLVQFLYLLVGGIVIYFLLTTIAPINGALFMVMAIPVGLFSLALAFLKIQDQPFPRFVGAFFLFVTRPKVRVWHRAGVDMNLVTLPPVSDKKEVVQHKTIKKSELERLSQALDTGGVTRQSAHHSMTPQAEHHEVTLVVAPVPRSKSSVTKLPPPNHLKQGRKTLDSMKKK